MDSSGKNIDVNLDSICDTGKILIHEAQCKIKTPRNMFFYSDCASVKSIL